MDVQMKKALQIGGPSHRVSARFYWSGREDLNLRPLGPEPSNNSLICPMNRALRRDGMPTACLFGCSDPAHTPGTSAAMQTPKSGGRLRGPGLCVRCAATGADVDL